MLYISRTRSKWGGMPDWTMEKQGRGGYILLLSDSEQDLQADSDAFSFHLLTSSATIIFSSTSAL